MKPIPIFLQFFRELRVYGHASLLDWLYPACMLSHFSCIRLFVTLWTLALQAPLSVEFSMQEYWSRLSCPPPGELPVFYSCSFILYSLQIWDPALYCDPHKLKWLIHNSLYNYFYIWLCLHVFHHILKIKTEMVCITWRCIYVYHVYITWHIMCV